jgi:dTDP-4-dehydrorhamnose 3,5-epimerase
MKIKSTKFKDLKVISSPIFNDSRGSFREVFKKKQFKKLKFVFNISSTSKKNVLRGLHLQTKKTQGKFLTVLKGAVFDVAVDLRKNSKTFSKYFAINLTDKNGLSVYIPPGFAHGFLCLGKENIVCYNCTNYRSEKHELGIKWNDKDINIQWPVKKPSLSSKDKNNISLTEYIKLHT